MTRMDFLHDLWANYLTLPPSKENSLKIRHLEMLMDEIQQGRDGLPIRKFVGDVEEVEYADNQCISLVFKTVSGPFRFSVDENPGVQQFFTSILPAERAVRRKWEVSDKLLLSLNDTNVLDAQWFVPWDGKIGPWITTKSPKGKEFHYRVISPWLQLAEFAEFIELRRLIMDRFLVYHCIAAAAPLDDLILAPAGHDVGRDPVWLSKARYKQIIIGAAEQWGTGIDKDDPAHILLKQIKLLVVDVANRFPHGTSLVDEKNDRERLDVYDTLTYGCPVRFVSESETWDADDLARLDNTEIACKLIRESALLDDSGEIPGDEKISRLGARVKEVVAAIEAASGPVNCPLTGANASGDEQ